MAVKLSQVRTPCTGITAASQVRSECEILLKIHALQVTREHREDNSEGHRKSGRIHSKMCREGELARAAAKPSATKEGRGTQKPSGGHEMQKSERF